MTIARFSGRAFYAGLVEALLSVMGSSNGYLREHGPRAAHLAKQLAEGVGLAEHEVAEIVLAGILCDVGMIGLAEEAWEVPTLVLDRRTRGLVRAHPIRSEATLAAIPHLDRVSTLVRSHHEWWNGSGYPDGLAGEEIPLGARILRLADTIAALGEHRPQRPARKAEEIRAIVRDAAGREFSHGLAELWLDLSADDRIAPFSEKVYERWSWEAAERVIPAEVSPISAEHLLEILASIIDAKDTYTAGHSRRVAALAVALARQMELEDELCTTLWAAGYLHDLGKLSVPVRVLAKPGDLTDAEARMVRDHTTRGAEVLEKIPTLRHLTTGARYHHERWDGSGYPEGLRGEQIPLLPRVLAVADAYDAMTSGRSYRASRGHEEAVTEIRQHAGRDFAPDVVKAFLHLPGSVFESLHAPHDWMPRPGFEELGLTVPQAGAHERGREGDGGRPA